MDRRGRLESRPFSHRLGKRGEVRIYRDGRCVCTVGGDAAARLIARLGAASDTEAQHLLARASGHYRHGNER